MSSRGDESQHLLSPNSSGGFPQQGQIDWANLGRSTVEFTVDALARLSTAGVDALTIYSARAMFKTVKLSQFGEQRVIDALQNTRAFASHNSVLWFGFGVKHIIRSLAESQQGIACIGICSCMGEEFSSSTASKILREMFELYHPPADLSPSLSQWFALVKSCQGTFASTNFGIILSELSRICLLDTRRHLPSNSAPEDVAKVLKGIFDVSNGAIERVFISGGADCAWLAAVAHWLLGLRVSVQDLTGNVVYRPGNLTSASTHDDQVIICFDTTETRASTLVSKSYFVPSGKILIERRGHDSDILAHGRLDWSTCLCDAFGKNMELLLTSYAFQTGSCLGSIARIYEYTACDSDGALIPEGTRKMACETLRGLKCYGRTFILQARDRLPELSRESSLFHAMKHTQEGSAENAFRQFSESMASIQKICSCGVCTMGHEPGEVQSGNEPFCMIGLIYTLCELVLLSSRIVFQDGLVINPTLMGLDRLYSEQFLHGRKGTTLDYLSILASRRGMSFNDSIEQALITFTGRSYGEQMQNFACSAITLDGMCVYSRSLCEIPSSLDGASQIYVVPGRIEWKGIQHDRIRESAPPNHRNDTSDTMSLMWYTGATDVTNYDNLADSSSPDLEAVLIIEENVHRFQELEAKWRISSSKGYCFLASRLERYIPRDFCNTTCPRRGCGSLNGFKSKLADTDGFLDCSGFTKAGQLFPSDPLIRVVAGNRLALWLALAESPNRHFEEYSVVIVPFLQGEQCIRCCVNNAMKRIPGGSPRVRTLRTCILTNLP
jgi:hypothetical protein